MIGANTSADENVRADARMQGYSAVRPDGGDRPTGTSVAVTRRRMLTGGAALAGLAAALPASALADTQTPPEPRQGRANPNGRFAGKVVLITGATSGIGKATAYAFAKEGARLFFCGRRTQLGQANEAEIRGFGGEATYMRADVRVADEVRAFVDGCVQTYGRIDIAFNNAGIETTNPAPLADQSLDDWQNVMATNATGYFLSMKYEIPHMLRQGGGVIVNNASVSAEVGFATIGPYSASKHAIASLTKVGALEYSAKNIRILGIAPGAVETPMLERALRGFNLSRDEAAEEYPIKRIVTAEEMARAVMWLASDEAPEIVGTTVDLTGGYLAQ